MMCNNINKRRARTVVAVVTVMTTVMASTSLVAAFVAVDNTPTIFSSITGSQQIEILKSSTNLYAKADATTTSEESKKKLSIETITDDNSSILLHPPAAPDRPVLVDAFAPWCGPCKLLDKVLRKAQPRYLDKVDFCRWNVNDKEGTEELKKLFLDSGYTLTKLPSLIVFREGKPVALRSGFANEFQLDDFLEKTLPDVLERTFDEDGVKMLPLPEKMMVQLEQDKKKTEEKDESSKPVLPEADTLTVRQAVEKVLEDEAEDQQDSLIECTDPEECWERVEKMIWQNRTVVPAMDGILLPSRSSVSP